jgi:hypothetical protein
VNRTGYSAACSLNEEALDVNYSSEVEMLRLEYVACSNKIAVKSSARGIMTLDDNDIYHCSRRQRTISCSVWEGNLQNAQG